VQDKQKVKYVRLGSIFMARKKSVKKAAEKFIKAVEEIEDFFQGTAALRENLTIWCAEYAVIRLYCEFEVLMLSTLVGAVNNDSTRISQMTGFKFPKHMSEDLCTYMIIGAGYFDFKGREGLLQTAKKYVAEDHYLYPILKDKKYKAPLEQLSALRNFVSHRSEKAKKAAIKATEAERLKSAGAWLRKQNRFEELCKSIKKLAQSIERKAPH
jgi:hypothetical protein